MGVLREGLLEEKGNMDFTWPSQTIAMAKGALDSPQNRCTNTLALDFYTVGGIVVKTHSQRCFIQGRPGQNTYPGAGK